MADSARPEDKGTGLSPVLPAWERPGTVWVVGVDGLTMDLMGPMMEAGRLPTFARLAREGCSGRRQGVCRPAGGPVGGGLLELGPEHLDGGAVVLV